MQIKHQWKDIAEKYGAADCTLDGKPARVRGRLCPFAKVGGIFGGPEFEFSWPTVQHIMEERAGQFKSN